MMPGTLDAREVHRRFRLALRALTGRTWTVRPCAQCRGFYFGLLIHAPRSRRLIAPDGSEGILQQNDVVVLSAAMPWAEEEIEIADEKGVLVMPDVLETLALLEARVAELKR